MADRAPPTPLATLIGTAIISLVTGYMLGLASSLGFLPNPFSSQKTARGARSGGDGYNSEESSSSEIDGDAILDHAPNWANGEEADRRQGLRASALATTTTSAVATAKAKSAWENRTEECKLVLVVRTDLGMTKGKIAAQCGHATLACYKYFLAHDARSSILRRWERQGQAKIALQVRSEEELQELQAKALSLGIVAEMIADAGRTQIASGSHTVLGVGPAPKSVIDGITGHLKLL
ncbi:MAG: hypothetical protein M1818_005727 [Claussenomyces sp. TS43310]|nr:MAG: hypothetical protein M1818_005727 [Claussenomyces sp. TS43310]